jgi:O-antigen ligase
MSQLNTNKRELTLIALHALIGFVVFLFRPSSVIINLLMVVVLLGYVFKSRHKTYAILVACAYVSTSDVFFRMTKGLLFYELHKYLLILFVLLGLVFELSKTKGGIYIIYMFLLLIGIAFTEYDVVESVRKMVAFNLGGPISLGMIALYCYKKQLPLERLVKVFFYALLPVVSMAIYLFLYTPSVQESVTGTASNFATSGGFGPNQVATILGLGMFVLITRLILNKTKGIYFYIQLGLLLLMSYRGLVTFSRGGILTALIAALFFIILTFTKAKQSLRTKLVRIVFVFGILGVGVWGYALVTTSGLIENRYANKNALGQEKADVSTGRSNLILVELEAFMEEPIFGIGVGKNKQYRFEKTGIEAASHNEISRLLAEHGIFGIVAFLILFFTPLFLRLGNRSNIYFYSCFLFWFLTINHSSMRIAFPSFIYGLALLDVTYKTKKKEVTNSNLQAR